MDSATPDVATATIAPNLPGPIISAHHLGKVYGSGKLRVEALRDVSFEINPGEFVAIVGPSLSLIHI